MAEENKPLGGETLAEAAAVSGTEPVSEGGSSAPAEDAPQAEQPPKRPEYTKFQRVMALLGAIFVIIVTLMYTYSIATGDLFFR